MERSIRQWFRVRRTRLIVAALMLLCAAGVRGSYSKLFAPLTKAAPEEIGATQSPGTTTPDFEDPLAPRAMAASDLPSGMLPRWLAPEIDSPGSVRTIEEIVSAVPLDLESLYLAAPAPLPEDDDQVASAGADPFCWSLTCEPDDDVTNWADATIGFGVRRTGYPTLMAVAFGGSGSGGAAGGGMPGFQGSGAGGGRSPSQGATAGTPGQPGTPAPGEQPGSGTGQGAPQAGEQGQHGGAPGQEVPGVGFELSEDGSVVPVLTDPPASDPAPGQSGSEPGGENPLPDTIPAPVPVPEPATLTLVGLGVGSALWRRRSQQRRPADQT